MPCAPHPRAYAGSFSFRFSGLYQVQAVAVMKIVVNLLIFKSTINERTRLSLDLWL